MREPSRTARWVALCLRHYLDGANGTVNRIMRLTTRGARGGVHQIPTDSSTASAHATIKEEEAGHVQADRRAIGVGQLGPPPSTPLPQVFDYVDAPYFVDGVVDKAHLYTYAAIVLCVDADSRMLTLQSSTFLMGLGRTPMQRPFTLQAVCLRVMRCRCTR